MAQATVKVNGDRGGGLPVHGQTPPERRDAARSRVKILEAARRLLRSQRAATLTMNQVAAAAGVGVGTVYRRFGDLGSLLHAVLDDEERALQDRFLHGEPPLGPAAPPAKRIVAFLHAYVDYLEANTDLLYEADTCSPGARFGFGAYAFYRQHLASLLGSCTTGLDVAYTADLLLAAVDAELYVTQRRELGMSAAQIKRALAAVVAAVTGAGEVEGQSGSSAR